MSTAEFHEHLQSRQYDFVVKANWTVIQSNSSVPTITLNGLKTLPNFVRFENDGHLVLDVIELDEYVEFCNKGDVALHHLQTMPVGVKFMNDGHVQFYRLEYISDDTVFQNQGQISGAYSSMLLLAQAQKQLGLYQTQGPNEITPKFRAKF